MNLLIFNKNRAVQSWNRLPRWLQFAISRFLGFFTRLSISRLWLPSFWARNELQDDYLKQFYSDDGSSTFRSFQSFFCRRLRNGVQIKSDTVWPCEGYVCEQGRSRELGPISVKGQKMSVWQIFGLEEDEISDRSEFVNIFLHNHNYHRVHAPTQGRITRIERIKGNLNFLRPWAYDSGGVSSPAFVNERVNIDIEDLHKMKWHLSIVGGMGVGTVVLSPLVQLNEFINIGSEMAHFRLGSTLCMIAPRPLIKKSYLESVFPGQSLCQVLAEKPFQKRSPELDLSL